MFAHEVPVLLLHSPRYSQGALALQETDHGGYSMLGRNLQTHMDMVRQQVPFDNPTLFLPGEVVKNLSQQCPKLTVNRLATIFGNKDHMILAIPPGMRQALHGSRHRQFSFR